MMFDNWMILTKLGWLAFIEFEAMMRMYFFQKTIGQGNLKQLAKQEHWKYLPASMVYEMIQLTAISLWSVLVRWSTRRTFSLEWKNFFGHLVLTVCQTHCHVPTPYLSWTAWFRLLMIQWLMTLGGLAMKMKSSKVFFWPQPLCVPITWKLHFVWLTRNQPFN